MALPIPWKTIGRVALGFAQYALAQRYAAQPPAPTPAPTAPPTPVPEASAPVAPPEPPQSRPLSLKEKWHDRLDVVYMEEWGRVIGEATSADATERYQGYVLLEAGREDELRKNLRGRK